MFLTLILSSMVLAEEKCTLDSIDFPSLDGFQSAVLKKYGATCKPSLDPENEKLAVNLYREVQKAIKDDDIPTAKAKINELMTKYSDTRIARRAKRTQNELNVFDKKLSNNLDKVEWLQGKASFQDAKLSLVVFWELWCPHCKREIPNLQKMYETFKGKELNIIGLTKLSRNRTTEDVMTFLQENNVSYPIGKEDGTLSAEFAVSGIPAAALVKDGTIIWRGHPASLTTEKIEKHLQ